MAWQSVAPIPQLVPCSNNGCSLAQPVRNGLFVGLYCKSKRTRRKFGASEHRSFTQFLSRSYSVKAVVDLQRSGAALDQSADSPSSHLKPQVADLHDIIAERGACGVGFFANLENKASHGIIEDALTALGCMEHRGGCGADNDSGDGSGLISSIPWDLFDSWANKQGISSFDKLHIGVGMVFLPKDDDLMKEAEKVIVNIFRREVLEVLGWRPVPVNASVVGYYAKEAMPSIQQVFVKVVKEENVGDIE